MLYRWAGSLITVIILTGVALILFLNVDRGPTTKTPPPAPPLTKLSVPVQPVGFHETPIGDEVEKNHMRIAAVWLPSVLVEGGNVVTGTDVIHLEADVKATEGNPNGFAKDEFIPYMQVDYVIAPAAGGRPNAKGSFMPMVARDGLHYGANVSMPAKGKYRLTYRLSSPSVGGLGRHHDPLTGVAPWWAPFEVSYDWDYQG